MPQTSHRAGWLYGALAALAMLLVAVGPHAYFFYKRGGEWKGTLPLTHGDEIISAAYLAGLNDGRPRRSEPYTGRDDAPGEPRHESMFSIQFLPPTVLVALTRLSGASSQQIFFALTPLSALLAALALFYLIRAVLADERTAAVGAVFVLCLGSAHVGVEYVLRGDAFYNHLSFLRRYVPSFAFPFFFIFCGLVWHALGGGRRAWLAALGAAVCFAILVYSYFFLWTAAAAWLFCLTLLWWLVRREDGREGLKALGMIWALAVAALLPYFVLLSHRAPVMDAAQLMVRTHAPDLFRLPELLGMVVIIALAGAVRAGRVALGDRAVLFLASLALTPLLVFNQQVVTGRSLQPNHYEMFGVGHAVLAAALMTAALIGRGERGRKFNAPALALLAVVAMAGGAYQALLAGRGQWAGNVIRDEARPGLLRLSEAGRDANGLDTRSLVFCTDPVVANALPTVAPQPVLWAPYMWHLSGVTREEDRERMSLYLHLAGVRFDDIDPRRFEELDRFRKFFVSSLISRARHNRAIRADWTPITTEEVEGALRRYSEFTATLDRAVVEKYPLSYVFTSPRENIDFTNLERWYERDAGERAGDFIIYRVRLRAAG